jgi:hypothetical protein
VFNFLDTFEERSLKLKVLDHEAKEEKERLEKSLQEVRIMLYRDSGVKRGKF